MPVLSRFYMKPVFHKVQSVAALPDFVLEVRFAGGAEKRYDMKPVFAAWPMFAGLRESPELFGEVAVGPGGYGVLWGDEWDVGADELFANGVPRAEGKGERGRRSGHGADAYGKCRMQNAQCTMGEGANDPTVKRCYDATGKRAREGGAA